MIRTYKLIFAALLSSIMAGIILNSAIKKVSKSEILKEYSSWKLIVISSWAEENYSDKIYSIDKPYYADWMKPIMLQLVNQP